MKIVLNYEPESGQIFDNQGVNIISWLGLDSHKLENAEGVSVDAICKLKNSGFTAEEIIEMKRKEVL